MKATCTVTMEITGLTREVLVESETGELVVKYSLVKKYNCFARLHRKGRRHQNYEIVTYPDVALLGQRMNVNAILRLVSRCTTMKPVILGLDESVHPMDKPQAFYTCQPHQVEIKFVCAEEEDEESPDLMTFDEVLENAKERNINVIALLPPVKEIHED